METESPVLDAATRRAEPDRRIEHVATPKRPGRFWGITALAAAALSVTLMAAVGLAGPSAAVPEIGQATGRPPWFWLVRPADLTVTLALWTAMVAGAAAVLTGLAGLRRGWRPRVRHLVVGGALAVATLTVVPPVGSTDMMDYATYGRAAVLGYDPHRITPRHLRDLHDPVAARSSRAWVDTPSVYGPAATVTQWAAASLGGASAATTVFWLKIWNGLAFLLVALALDRIVAAGRDRVRRLRAHLLWTVNPLMLWAVMAGGHVDGLAIGCAAAGLWALYRLRESRPLVAGLLAGLLIGVAAAVKAPYALIGAGVLWALRRSPRLCVALSVTMAAVLVPSYLLADGEAVRALLHRGQKVSPASLWMLIAAPFDQNLPAWFLSWGVLAVTTVLAIVLVRGLSVGTPEVPLARPALAFCLAWLVMTPVYHSWYDVMVFPLLALVPASGLDGLLLIRGAIAVFGFLPGVVGRLQPPWLNELGHHPAVVATVPIGLLALTTALVWRSARRRIGGEQALTVC